jgi:hypothetical protein
MQRCARIEAASYSMKVRRIFGVAIAALLLVAASSETAKGPANWDGLVQVSSKRLDLVFLQPGADFRGYTKVLVEPTEVAFHKDWQRDYNRSNRSLSARVSDSEMQEAVRKAVIAGQEIFTRAWADGGYTVVNAPGPDVLRVRSGVVNIVVAAPDTQSPGRAYTFSESAGQAALFVEARDSMTGAILGRAVDQKIIGDNTTTWRTSSSNRADFRDQVEEWARLSVRGIAELKALSPVHP